MEAWSADSGRRICNFGFSRTGRSTASSAAPGGSVAGDLLESAIRAGLITGPNLAYAPARARLRTGSQESCLFTDSLARHWLPSSFLLQSSSTVTSSPSSRGFSWIDVRQRSISAPAGISSARVGLRGSRNRQDSAKLCPRFSSTACANPSCTWNSKSSP